MNKRALLAIACTLSIVPFITPADAFAGPNGQCTTAAILVSFDTSIRLFHGLESGPSFRASEPFEAGNYVNLDGTALGTSPNRDYEFSGETNRFACGLDGTTCTDGCVASSSNVVPPPLVSFEDCTGVALSEPVTGPLRTPNFSTLDFTPVGSSSSPAHFGVEFYRDCLVNGATTAVLVAYVRVAPIDGSWTSFGFPSYRVYDLLVSNQDVATSIGAQHADFFDDTLLPTGGNAQTTTWRMVGHGPAVPPDCAMVPVARVCFEVTFEIGVNVSDPFPGGSFNRHHFMSDTRGSRRTIHHEDTFLLERQVTSGLILSANSGYETSRQDEVRSPARGHVFADVDWTYGLSSTGP